MFRCTALPPEPTFPSTLQGLNMCLNAEGTPVDATTGRPFAFYYAPDERVNDIRKEAFHTAIRAEMKLKLAELGISEYYITANNVLQAEKPLGKHIPVLMSPASSVKTARDVVIVVGESGQDCGVFAWRLVRKSIQRGTAVGMVEAVKAEFEGKEETEMPAMVFLNPGQLYYSYKHQVAKTLVSWNDGPRGKQEFAAPIDEENRMSGHETAREHVNTCIEKILPTLINKNARLFVVAIGDAAEHVLTALDKQIRDKTAPPSISRQFEGVALVCPQITTPKQSFCQNLRWQIAMEGKAWILSEKPLGELLATPVIRASELFGTHRAIKHLSLEKLCAENGDSMDSNSACSTKGSEIMETAKEHLDAMGAELNALNGDCNTSEPDLATTKEGSGPQTIAKERNAIAEELDAVQATQDAMQTKVDTRDSEVATMKDSFLSFQGDPVTVEEEDPEAEKARIVAEAPLAMTFSAGQPDDAIIETALDVCMGKVLEFLWMKRDGKLQQEATNRELERQRFRAENDSKLGQLALEDQSIRDGEAALD